jgi:hypothetical protein
MVNCLICNTEFTLKNNLTKHLNNGKCKNVNYKLIHEQLEELQKLKLNNNNNKNADVINNGTVNGNIINNNINIKIELNIKPANKLDISHITPEYMKTLIEEYDVKPEKVNLLLGDYVKEIICNPEHPENHSVKYIKKKPATFSSVIDDRDGNKITVIKNLKDTCELLSDPIIDTLKIKLREFCKKYKTNDDFDYDIYEETIKELRREFNKVNVKKALSSVLQNDILNNIEMKLTLE